MRITHTLGTLAFLDTIYCDYLFYIKENVNAQKI